MRVLSGDLVSWISGCLFLGVAGCSVGQSDFLAGDLNGVNHTSAAINYFSVNGYRGRNISSYGYGGGTCCVMLPTVWRPGLKVLVEWEKDPNPKAKLPNSWGDEYDRAYALHKANYKFQAVVVDVPPYEDKVCSPEVHFLPCDQIKISTSCWAFPSPNSPIKEPLKMKEPAVCPK